MKRLAKLEPVGETIEERVAPFILPSPVRPLAPPLMRLENVDIGYGDDPAVLRGLDLRLDIDDRIGLLGVNGAGKSTFAKMAAGALGIRSGRMQREGRIKVGWFHQHQIEAMDPDDTPLEIARRTMPEISETAQRSRLAQWGLAFSKQETTVFDLSGGERARLLLNLVAAQAPHLLILDEPTNHLDIDSRRMLLDALNDYEGAVVLITHDRSLMEMVADRLWLAADGTIAPFEGDMDDYAKFVLDRARRLARADKEPAAPKNDKKAAAAARAALAPLKKELDAVEAKVARITKTLAEIDLALADPKLFKRPNELAQLGRDRSRAQDNLAKAEAEWLEAAEKYETAKAAS